MEYNWFSDTRRMISGTKKQVNKFRAPKFIFFKALLPLSLISFLLVILVKRNGTGLVVQRERLRPLSSDSAGLTPNLTRTSDGLTGQTTKPLTFSSQAVSPGEHSPGMSSNSSGLSADLNRTSDSLTGQSTKTLTFSKQSVISSEILPGMSSDAPGLSANLNKPYDGLASSARSVSPGQKSAGGVMNNSASSFPSPDQHTRYNAGQAKKEQKKVAEGQRDPAWRCSTRDAQQEIESLVRTVFY
ncbi:hypothetical protein BaRGS_00026952 [Batillaria attramentaria]|uniref:Uncharacterized protein n=1 Tax=Batillaria attramentaria TaxID=370345 RepID=A0ABD0K321_9CAEN